MKNSPILFVVIPCYNEEEVIFETTKRLKGKLEKLISDNSISKKSKVLYVNDGSKDKTWELICKICSEEKLFTSISLSCNRGHQNALVAGLLTAKEKADVIISMDADLQDDINAIDEMLIEYKKGNEIVYGVRSKRKKDTFFKRFTAEAFYKVMKMMGVKIIFNHADYRLTSKKVLEEFEKYKEVNLFLRSIFPLIGFKSSIVYYERSERFAGESKYPLKKMLNFAWDGITSFSIKPIRFILVIGTILFIINTCAIITLLILKFCNLSFSNMWFLALSIWMVASILMISLGIVGEYIGKCYMEIKCRPRYVIEKNLDEKRS